MEITSQQQSAQKLYLAAKNLVKASQEVSPSMKQRILDARINFGKEFANIPDEDKRTVVSQTKEISQSEGASLVAQSAYDNIEYRYHDYLFASIISKVENALNSMEGASAKEVVAHELNKLTDNELATIATMHRKQKSRLGSRASSGETSDILEEALQSYRWQPER